MKSPRAMATLPGSEPKRLVVIISAVEDNVLSFSVVISTYNRALTLVDTLTSLERQTFKNFEVIVVNGPSTDETLEILSRFQGRLTALETKNRNLSESRNIGISASHGDVVAFLDDDAVADPNWLRDLAVPYEDLEVGGVGGLVYDHTGAKLQYKYSACYRRGTTTFDIVPPFDALTVRGADPFLYIQGTNCSFRRVCLQLIGGFNEQIEYYHDETEVCLRIIDAGYKICSLDKASVIHRYAPSHVRNKKRVVFDPYTTVKNQHLFAIQNGSLVQSMQQIYSSLGYYTDTVREGGRWHFKQGDFTSEQLRFFLDQVNRAVSDGVAAGFAQRKSVAFTSADSVIKPFIAGESALHLNIVYISQELPPGTIGGIGRFTLDLARAMARAGHTVHIITRGDAPRIEYNDGLYIHYIKYVDPSADALKITPLAWTIAHLLSVYSYLLALSSRFEVDIISGPIWLAESLFAALSRRWVTVLTLHTTMKTVSELHPNEAERPEAKMLIALEELAYRSADMIQSNSEAVRLKSAKDYGDHKNVLTVPHGIDPIVGTSTRQHKLHDRLNVLFVGRVELRKGADTLLETIDLLFPMGDKSNWPKLNFIIAGPSSNNTGVKGTFSEWFGERRPDLVLSNHVRFTGEVTSEDLEELYRDADIFVLPSRFESFGLVLLEAMRYGVPVIASDTSGMAEIVNADCGRTFTPSNSSALAERILELANSPNLRLQLGKEAIRAVETKFNITEIAARIEAKYTELLRKYERRRSDMEFEEMEFVVKLSPIINCSFDNTRKLVSELFKPLTPENRMEALLTSMSSDNDGDFFHKCYRLVLGREYEQYISLETASEYVCVHSTRAAFLSSMLRSDEARASAFAMELYGLWHNQSI
jgi:glycogen(starch) synthase